MDLTGRVAVVIGGTSGIGRTLAAGLAAAGADVVPTGRREAMIEEVCAEIESAGGKTMRQACDIGSRESVDRFRDAVLARFSRVDVLLNAAGQTFRKPTADVSEEQWNRILDVNLTGMLRTCQSFYRPLAASRRGRIVNIASLTSFVAFYEVTAYAASKGAVLALTRNLAIEWARDGINVNAIAPGVVDTPMWDTVDSLFAKYENRPIGEKKKLVGLAVPFGRMGRPDDYRGPAVFLASSDSDYVVAQCLNVDGGNWMS